MPLPEKPVSPDGRASLQFRIGSRIHRTLYRLTGGRLGGSVENAPVLLLTHTGRKSGKQRTLPLVYLTTDRGFAVVASFAGSDNDPAWYLNLKAQPQCAVRVKTQSLSGYAETMSDDRAALYWPKLIDMYPGYRTYQERTTRRIAVVEILCDPPAVHGRQQRRS